MSASRLDLNNKLDELTVESASAKTRADASPVEPDFTAEVAKVQTAIDTVKTIDPAPVV